MSPDPTARSGTPRAPTAGRGRHTPNARRPPARVVVAISAILMLILGACGPAFDPTGPCTTDGAAPGAYPALEAAVPATFRGSPPKQLDSGRTCTAAGLSTLAGHGVAELRFAGATWETGTDSGVSLAVFLNASGPALERNWLVEFYETGARAGRNVQSVDTSDYSLGGDMAARRIDVLNGESFQTVVVWSREDRIVVALVADFIREIQTREAHDKVVREATDAWALSGARVDRVDS
ncbi:MAG TPA: hypothetical protein VFY18_02140 [Candidatus Limnocylindrales bacterium]|nr:hypothetical protein [Candidatus Limnocylindrales bacterium]